MMKTIRSSIVAGVLVLAGFSTLHADSVADKIGVSGFAGASFPVGDESVMDHTGSTGHDFGGMLRVGVSPRMSVGASYNNINLFGKDGERHHPETLLANVLYHLRPEKKLVPTLQLGAGIGSSLSDGAFDKFSARAGLGLDYFFCPHLSAGPQVNYTFIDNSGQAVDEYHAVAVGLMVSLFFDKPKDSAPDATTSTLAPMLVPTPSTLPPAAAVKPIVQDVSIQLKVLFDTGKTAVKPDYRSEIEQVAKFMNRYSDSTAEIEGHTDNIGSASLNKRISQDRANAVRDYLIKEFQIEPARVTAMGYGEEKPIADNATKEGQQRNRRVVATLRASRLVHPNQSQQPF